MIECFPARDDILKQHLRIRWTPLRSDKKREGVGNANPSFKFSECVFSLNSRQLLIARALGQSKVIYHISIISSLLLNNNLFRNIIKNPNLVHVGTKYVPHGTNFF